MVIGSFDEVIGFFYLPNPSSRTIALVLTQRLTEISSRNLPGGKGPQAGAEADKYLNIIKIACGWLLHRPKHVTRITNKNISYTCCEWRFSDNFGG
jgi:hypothetical protein